MFTEVRRTRKLELVVAELGEFPLLDVGDGVLRHHKGKFHGSESL